MCNFYLEGGAALHDGLSDVIKVPAISQPVNHHILDGFTILGLLNETTYCTSDFFIILLCKVTTATEYVACDRYCLGIICWSLQMLVYSMC